MARPDNGPPEIERLVRRWQQLPAHQALSSADLVRALVDELAVDTADRTGRAHEPVPDLGHGALIDQLTVLAYDARHAGVPDVDTRLADLRRVLP